MLFNPEESIDFNGNTGPFIQYTYARIRSILRKNDELRMTNDECVLLPNVERNDDSSFVTRHSSLSDKEIALIQQLAAFPAAVAQAGSDYNVSVIANYCYDLAKEFNGFYHDFQILKEPDEQKRAVRLALCESVAKVIKTGMGLLGIEVPERM
jgi:arginyl-tRNA synthetase